MVWIQNYQLFLFDFDGLLVDTERLHYLAYKKMLDQHGIELTWDFPRYCLSAHYSADKFHKDLYEEFPQIKAYFWEELYKEKQHILKELLHTHPPELMEGASAFLEVLQENSIDHCVVTHSPDTFVHVLRKKHPVLDRIPFWITRHDYTHPKPNPECYQLAIARYAKPEEKIIGFEDTPRGLTALMGTSSTCVLVTQVSYPEIPFFLKQGVQLFPTMQAALQDM